MDKLKFFFLLLCCNLFKCQLINFVPDTANFDLIEIESRPYNDLVDLTDDEYQEDCLQAHNEKRRLHGSKDLVFDQKLLADAKEAAYQSVINGKFTKLQDSPYGVNLASSNKKLTCTNAVNLWYKQRSIYNYHFPLYSSTTGAFTQLVWRETKSFACAQARSSKSSKKIRYFTVCAYDPFGNVVGQFGGNVYPPVYSNETSLNSVPEAELNLRNTIIHSATLVVAATESETTTSTTTSTAVNSTLVNGSNNVVKPKNFYYSPSMMIRLNKTKSDNSLPTTLVSTYI